MKTEVSVENIKCGGCANSIKQKLLALPDVLAVEVDVEAGIVTIDFGGIENPESGVNTAQEKLTAMGYPPSGSVEGLKAAGAKAKSFVSCAVGRMSDSSSK